MVWYAGHIVLWYRLKRRPQKRFIVWENVVLINAESEEEVFAKAEAIGREDARESDDGTLHVNDEPAELVFAGVRKLVLCRNEDRRPTDGTEVSYTQMEVQSEEAIHKLVVGEAVRVTIADVFPDNEPAADTRRLARRCS